MKKAIGITELVLGIIMFAIAVLVGAEFIQIDVGEMLIMWMMIFSGFMLIVNSIAWFNDAEEDKKRQKRRGRR